MKGISLLLVDKTPRVAVVSSNLKPSNGRFIIANMIIYINIVININIIVNINIVIVVVIIERGRDSDSAREEPQGFLMTPSILHPGFLAVFHPGFLALPSRVSGTSCPHPTQAPRVLVPRTRSNQASELGMRE